MEGPLGICVFLTFLPVLIFLATVAMHSRFFHSASLGDEGFVGQRASLDGVTQVKSAMSFLEFVQLYFALRKMNSSI